MSIHPPIPAPGTKAACRYWAKRTRESLRDAEQEIQRGNLAFAEDLAIQASGEAADYAEAVRALADVAA
jgi:hypothetical protein